MADNQQRVAWVDYAKGFCIIMVVMMHSTLGVEKAAGAEGWMTYVVAFAKPFRMPDFFMISGLFLARVIDRDWRTYLDKKVFHFGYFYVLWLTIQFVFKAPGIAADGGAAEVARHVRARLHRSVRHDLVHLPAADLLRAGEGDPGACRGGSSGVGAALQMANIHTGWTIIDEFALRFVYFYSGYIFAPHIFRFAAAVLKHIPLAARLPRRLGAGERLRRLRRRTPNCRASASRSASSARSRSSSLSTLLSRSDLMAPVRYCGRNSIVIYLAFFLPMATARALLLKVGIITDLGTISLIVTACGVIFPLVLYWIVRDTPARFLFERPAWAHLRPRRTARGDGAGRVACDSRFALPPHGATFFHTPARLRALPCP